MRVELALSLAGHDKGHYYVVVGEEAEAVYVADGELKRLHGQRGKPETYSADSKIACRCGRTFAEPNG